MNDIPDPREVLSDREIEILQELATGATNRQIAQNLFISVNTVKVHLRNVFSKLEVESRVEATLYAVRAGLVEEIFPAETGESKDTEAEEEGEAKPELPLPEPLNFGRGSAPISGAKRLFLVLATLIVAAFTLLPQRASRSDASRDLVTPIEQPTPKQSHWTALAHIPTPRGWLAVAVYENALYAIGGIGVSGSGTDAVEMYNIANNTWIPRAAKPTAASDIGAVTIGDKIYVPGGYTAFGEVSDVLEIYDPENDEWTKGASLPRPVHAYAATALNDKMYLFGGHDGENNLNLVYEYDPSADRWQEKKSMPTARSFAGAAAVGETIYVIGGYNGQELAVNEAYSPARDEWQVKSPMPTRRSGIGVVAANKQIYVVGGGWEETENYLYANLRYSPLEDSWRDFETPLTGIWRNAGVVAVQNKIYAVGGWNGNYLSTNQEYRTTFEIFIPAMYSGE